MNPADYVNEGDELGTDGNPVIKHRRRGDGSPPRAWCGREKAPDERWANKWDETTCPDCHTAKADSKNAPPPEPQAPENPYAIQPHHEALGTALSVAAVAPAINRVLDRRGRQNLQPEGDQALRDFLAASAMVADHYGWLDYLNSPWGVLAFSGMNLAVAVARTPEKKHAKDADSPSDSGATGDRENPPGEDLGPLRVQGHLG